MDKRTIHIFHPRPTLFSALIRDREPDRPIVLLASREELRAALASIRVLFAPFAPREGWSGAARLELVQLAGVGADLLLPSPDLPGYVRVAGMRGAFADDVAEHAMMMLLALTKELPRFFAAQRARRWEQRAVRRLRDRKLAILGLGAIGRSLAKRASAFGMAIRGMRRAPRPTPHVDEVVGMEELDALLSWSDAVVVCLPRTPLTCGALDAKRLAQLPEDALLVNVARGGIVEEEALLTKLADGSLGGAAVDVFEDEPLPSTSPFWTAPNTIVTPHVAGLGEGYLDRAVEILLENVGRLERGEPLVGRVDRNRGY